MRATVLATSGAILWRLIEFHGRDAEPLFRKVGIDPKQIREPDARIPDEAEDRAWNLTAQMIDDPCFGLHAARTWHPSNFGALGYAWLASSSLRTALNRLVRYARVIADRASITLAECDQGLLVRFNAGRQQAEEIVPLVDATLAIVVDMCRVNYGEVLDPVAVNLRRSPPPCAGRYFAYFRCPVNFNARENNLILPSEAADRPLPGANAELARMHDQVLAQYLAHLDRNDVVAKVRVAIVDQLPSGAVLDETVAVALNMSSRTLQRRLQEAGTSFAHLLEETRRELALKYIADTHRSLSEIAYLLGFSELSAFSRSFKRWTGRAPSRFRNK